MKEKITIIFFSTFLVLLLVSCGSLPYSKNSNWSYAMSSKPNFQSVFYQDTTSHVYDLRIYIQKKQFSGLLFFKQIDDMHRFSMLTKTGQKLIDISVNETDMIVHHVMAELDRKIILDQLKRDLRLLILNCGATDLSKVQYLHADDVNFYRLASCEPVQDSYTHFIYNDEGRLIQLGTGGKRKLKQWVKFENYNEGLPQHMTVDHRSLINLRLELFNLAFEQE